MTYTLIKTKKQFREYVDKMYELELENKNSEHDDEIELLALLVEEYESRINVIAYSPDAIEMVKYLMAENDLKNTYMAKLLGVSPGHFSNILQGRKELSKKHIAILAVRFNVNPAIFLQAYTKPGDLVVA